MSKQIFQIETSESVSFSEKEIARIIRNYVSPSVSGYTIKVTELPAPSSSMREALKQIVELYKKDTPDFYNTIYEIATESLLSSESGKEETK